MTFPGLTTEEFTKNHVLTRPASIVNTNLGDQLTIEIDGRSYFIDLNKRLPSGTNAFPAIDQLTAGMMIRATYSKPAINDPLVNSQAPQLLSIEALGPVPAYEVLVRTVPLNSEELSDTGLITERIQRAVVGHGRVVGIRNA